MRSSGLFAIRFRAVERSRIQTFAARLLPDEVETSARPGHRQDVDLKARRGRAGALTFGECCPPGSRASNHGVGVAHNGRWLPQPFEPRFRLEPLEDLARFGQQRLRLLGAPLRGEPLGVFEPRDG
jgi:hypothetical protein